MPASINCAFGDNIIEDARGQELEGGDSEEEG